MPAPRFSLGVVISTFLNALAQYVDDVRTGILAIGVRTTNSSTTTTTEIGVLRVDDVPITGGHRIEVKVNAIFLHSTTTTDVVRATIRYTTDGSTPTVSSTQLCAAQISVANNSFPATNIASGTYVPSSDQTLSVLLTVIRMTGGGNVQILATSTFPAELSIVDLGIDTGDVGVDL